MPCYDDRSSDENRAIELRRERQGRDEAARAACAALRALEALKAPIPQPAAAWWAKHKKFDTERGEG